MADDKLTPELGKFPGIMGPHTQRAVEKLKTGTPGDTITREQMTAVVGRDCSPNGMGYGNVNTAIRHTEKFHGICWRWDREDKAWRCLDDTQKTKVQRSYNQSSRRAARRGLVVGATVDMANLNDADKQEHNANMSAAGMIYLCGGGAFRKRLGNVTGKLREPEPAQLIELMKQDS